MPALLVVCLVGWSASILFFIWRIWIAPEGMPGPSEPLDGEARARGREVRVAQERMTGIS